MVIYIKTAGSCGNVQCATSGDSWTACFHAHLQIWNIMQILTKFCAQNRDNSVFMALHRCFKTEMTCKSRKYHNSSVKLNVGWQSHHLANVISMTAGQRGMMCMLVTWKEALRDILMMTRDVAQVNPICCNCTLYEWDEASPGWRSSPKCQQSLRLTNLTVILSEY